LSSSGDSKPLQSLPPSCISNPTGAHIVLVFG
jgi:hypothetical protein